MKVYGGKVLNLLEKGGSSLGYTHKTSDRLKMSEAKIGIKNNMYNKKHTDSTKNLIRTSMINVIKPAVTSFTRLKISKAKTGKTLSLETRAKIAKALKNRTFGDSTINKLKIAAYGRKPTQETIDKMSLSHSIPVRVKNINDGVVQDFASIKLAAKSLASSSTTVRRHIKNGRPFKGNIITKKKFLNLIGKVYF